MIDYIKISLYTLVAVFILAFALPIYEQAERALDLIKTDDKSMVNSGVLYKKDDYVKVYKYVNGEDAMPHQNTTYVEVNGKQVLVKEELDRRSTVYGILTLLNTFCIQGKYMDCDRLYFKDRYITKTSAQVVSLRSALSSLDVSGEGKYILTVNGKDCRFVELEGDGTIFVKGE